MKRLLAYEKSFNNLSDFLFILSLHNKASEISYLLVKLIKKNDIFNIDIYKHKKTKYINKQSLQNFWIICKYKCPECGSVINLKFSISMYNYNNNIFGKDGNYICIFCKSNIKLK